MIRKFNYLILILFILISCGNEKKIEEKGFKIVDELNNTINFDKVPERIVSSAPNLTEIIYALQLQDKLVGRTSYCNFPPDVLKKEVVGDLLNINIEKLLELKADLVLLTVEGNTKSSYDKIRSVNINVVVTNPRNIDGINKTIKLISKIFNVEQKADSIIKNFEHRMSEALSLNQNKTKPTCMFLVASAPLMLAGSNTFINDIIEKSGFTNIAANSKVPYPQFNREEILKLNPEFLIVPAEGETEIKDLIKTYPEWKNLKAIKENKIIKVNADVFFRPGPRYINAIEYLVKMKENFK